MAKAKMYPVGEALKAQKALRSLAELGPELFPLDAFVGVISDEVEALRRCGKTDTETTAVIHENSSIEITAEDIQAHYVSPQERHRHQHSKD